MQIVHENVGSEIGYRKGLLVDALFVHSEFLGCAWGQLQRIVDQKGLIAENDRALQDVDAQMRGLTADEDRVRRNIQSLNNVAGQQQQVQTYARQLDSQEQQLAGLRDRQAELQKKRSTMQSELDKSVEALTF